MKDDLEDKIHIDDILVELMGSGTGITQNEPVSIPEAIRIKIPNEIDKSLFPLGISNIFVMFFDENFGPRLYLYTKRDEMIERILENPTFGAEVTILAKYANEILLKNGKRLIIRDIIIDGKQYYLFVQVNKGFISPKPLKVAKIMAEEFERNKKIDGKILINALDLALKGLARFVQNKT